MGVLTCVLVGAATGCAVVFKNLGVILGLTGAIGGSILVWILPGLFLLKMGRMGISKDAFFRDGALFMSPPPLPTPPSVPATPLSPSTLPLTTPEPHYNESSSRETIEIRFRIGGYVLVTIGTLLLFLGT